MAIKICKKTLVMEGEVPVGLKFEFGNGNVHEVIIADMPEGLTPHALANGYGQTLVDSFSGSKGSPATAESKFLDRLDTLINIGWTKGTRAGVADDDLALALARITGADLEDARKRVAEESDEWKETRRKRVDVKAEIAAIRAERAKDRAEAYTESVDDLL